MTKPLAAFRMLALVAALCILKLYSQVPQPNGAGVEPGVLPLKRLQRKGRESIRKMVIHTHGHSDYIAGDAQFQNRPDIEFVPYDIPSMQNAFHIDSWPESTGLLLIGDTLYPGRLYVTYWDQFDKSIERIVRWTDGKIITHILGCHIEQTNKPYLESPIGSFYQPEEHELAMSRGHLLELHQALIGLKGKPTRLAFRDFTIWPLGPEVSQEKRTTRQTTEERLRAMPRAEQLKPSKLNGQKLTPLRGSGSMSLSLAAHSRGISCLWPTSLVRPQPRCPVASRIPPEPSCRK